MIEVRQSERFTVWLTGLRDRVARAAIGKRIDRLALGNPGDVSSLGGRLSELRIHHGPGYRVYFTRRGDQLILLLCGGDKSSQARDIEQARLLEREM